MRPSMLEFLPPKPSRSPFCAKTMVVWRPAVRPPVSYQVLAVVFGVPDNADGAVAVGVAAGGVGGHVDGAVLAADDGVDGLRDVAADGFGEDGEVTRRPGGAVVRRGREGEGRSADEAGESPEEPCGPPGWDWNFGSFQMTGAARPASAKMGNGSGMSQSSVPARRRMMRTVWSGSSSRSGVL